MALRQPDGTQHDQHQRRKQRTGQHEQRGQARQLLDPPQCHQRDQPVESDDDNAGINPVARQCRIDDECQRIGSKRQNDRQQRTDLDPAEPAGKNAERFTECLPAPAVHATAPGRAQFGGDQRCRQEKQQRRQQVKHDGTQSVECHAWQGTDAGHGCHRHQREQNPRHAASLRHNDSLKFDEAKNNG